MNTVETKVRAVPFSALQAGDVFRLAGGYFMATPSQKVQIRDCNTTMNAVNLTAGELAHIPETTTVYPCEEIVIKKA